MGLTLRETEVIRNSIVAQPRLNDLVMDVATDPRTRLTLTIANLRYPTPQLALVCYGDTALELATKLDVGHVTLQDRRVTFHGNRLVKAILEANPEVSELFADAIRTVETLR